MSQLDSPSGNPGKDNPEIHYRRAAAVCLVRNV